MNEHSLREALKDLEIGQIHFFEETDSTNERALVLSGQGAPEFTLVIAERQTAGRGRFGRRWETAPGTSLAFTVIFFPTAKEQERLSLFSFLGAVAVCRSIEAVCPIEPRIKWPNDVLLDGKKACGILAETSWQGNKIEGLVLGIGINLLHGSIPPAELLMYPATCVQAHCGNEINSLAFLKTVINELKIWRPKLLSLEFLNAYRSRLAFLGEMVTLSPIEGEAVHGIMAGIDNSGNLILKGSDGSEKPYPIGDMRLREANDSGKE